MTFKGCPCRLSGYPHSLEERRLRGIYASPPPPSVLGPNEIWSRHASWGSYGFDCCYHAEEGGGVIIPRFSTFVPALHRYLLEQSRIPTSPHWGVPMAHNLKLYCFLCRPTTWVRITRTFQWWHIVTVLFFLDKLTWYLMPFGCNMKRFLFSQAYKSCWWFILVLDLRLDS